MTLHLLYYFQPNLGYWIPRGDIAEDLGVDMRQVQDLVGELNNRLSVEGSRYLVCSSTGSPSGYCYTDNPEITERFMRQIRAHALSELKKYRPAKIALKRQREYRFRTMEPIIEPSGQVRLGI